MKLTIPEVIDTLPRLELQGATWKTRIIKAAGGERRVLLFDILTADDLLNMNPDAMTSEDLQALLPNVIDLLDNIESINPEDYELSADECEQIQEALEEKQKR